MKIKDLTGKKFGKLTALEHVGFAKGSHALWRCVCDCGKEKTVRGATLINGGSKSCGCYRTEYLSQTRLNDIIEGEETAKIVLTRKDGTIVHALIDKADIDKIRSFGRRWAVHIDNKNGCQYAYTYTSDRKHIALHRFLTDCPDGKVVDHINHNGLDNRRCNLKIVTMSENKQNLLGANRNSTSGIRGVSWHKSSGKWQARIKLKQRSLYLGLFKNKEDAEKAAIQAREQYFENNNPLFK